MRNSARRASFEELLIAVTERLLSELKSARVGEAGVEPYTESSETADHVRLTAELVGANPLGLRVVAAKNRVEIVFLERGIESSRRSYAVPDINPESLEMRFNNGVLEVKARRGLRTRQDGG